ncbi:MAG: hypothetical protein DDT41_01596 [candidate division WS2 bacterium]|nr:hypothetical protein [Candidatus Psychracetigena formicireducens]
MKHILRAYKYKQGHHHPMIGIDIENDVVTGDFICGGVYGQRKRWKKHADLIEISEYFDSLDEFHNYLENIPKWACIFVFFNLGYDNRYLYPIMDTSKTIISGNRYIQAIVKQTKVKCWDLHNHVDGSLKDWIEYLHMEEQYGIKKEDLNDKKRRVMSDAEATFRLGCFIEDFYYKECGMPMRSTVAANALLLFRMKFFKDYWARDSDIRMDLEFKAYYGGRVECIQKGEYDYYSYDVNSCYLSAMRENLYPDMLKSVYIENGDSWKKYWDFGYQMIMDCDVEVPDCYLPVLPFRCEELGGKLIFPIGTFRSCWTSDELAYALNIGLARIIKCHQFIYYKKSKPYFRDLATFVWEKRREYKEKANLGMDLMIKKIGNSLYGKFAQHKMTGRLVKEEDFKGDTEGLRVHHYFNELWIQEKDENKPALYCFPGISAFVSCFARIALHKAMIANIDTLIYIDTDSNKCSEEAKGIKISKDLGDWGFECKSRARFIKSKVYIDTLDNKKSAIKGVKKNAKKIEETPNSITFEFDRPDTFLEAIKGKKKMGIWTTHTKELVFKDDKRILLKDGKTKPIKLEYGMIVKEYSQEEIEIQNEILKLSAMVEGIEEYLEQSELTQYLSLVSKTGQNRGEIAHLTVNQFRKFMGYEPKESFKGKVRWEYSIDQLASRHNMGDEQFCREVENLYQMKRQLSSLKAQLKELEEMLKEG